MEDALGESVEVSKTRHSYDLIAVAYAAAMADELGGKPLDRALLDVVAELAAGGAIVDVNCGPGQVMAHLAGRGARVVGLDLSPVMCATGARATSLPFCAAEMTALPIRSRTLAAIVRLYAVIHLGAAQRGAAYHEFALRVVPSQGRISATRLLPPGPRVRGLGPQLPSPGRGAESVVAQGSSPWTPAGGVDAG